MSIVLTQQPRIVYAAKSVQHAILLQSRLEFRNPTSIVALPSHATHIDVERYMGHLRIPLLCARASLRYPLRSLDILQYTACNKLLLGHTLVEMDEEKVVGLRSVEEVFVVN